MKAVLYARVSSEEQIDNWSPSAQKHVFHEICQQKGWQAGEIYGEEGVSAHTDSIDKRLKFKSLLEDCRHKPFGVVVVHSLDRWSRNLKITLESFKILADSNIAFLSVTENIDYSTPQGRLFTQMLGSFAEYFSGSLSNHVKKGLNERALQGKHTGGIPFGYESCWTGAKGEKTLRCNPEHAAGIHIHPKEGHSIAELFRRYATGSTTLGQLASWMNDQGFKTRNMHKLEGPDGTLSAEPRLFTTASIRGILHNPFYTGQVTHRDKLFPGLHDALVSQEIFDIVQVTLKKNSGRSETLSPRPERYYLLKGLARCAHRDMPMWA